jgi:hypothetical protein
MKSVLFALALLIVSSPLFGQAITIDGATLLASCPAPAAKTVVQCSVANDPANADGVYVSANGAAYFKVTAVVGTGVASFNGRAGAVVSVAGDYSYADLSAPPTTVDCSTWSVAQNGHLTGSGCVIK